MIELNQLFDIYTRLERELVGLQLVWPRNCTNPSGATLHLDQLFHRLRTPFALSYTASRHDRPNRNYCTSGKSQVHCISSRCDRNRGTGVTLHRELDSLSHPRCRPPDVNPFEIVPQSSRHPDCVYLTAETERPKCRHLQFSVCCDSRIALLTASRTSFLDLVESISFISASVISPRYATRPTPSSGFDLIASSRWFAAARTPGFFQNSMRAFFSLVFLTFLISLPRVGKSTADLIDATVTTWSRPPCTWTKTAGGLVGCDFIAPPPTREEIFSLLSCHPFLSVVFYEWPGTTLA